MCRAGITREPLWLMGIQSIFVPYQATASLVDDSTTLFDDYLNMRIALSTQARGFVAPRKSYNGTELSYVTYYSLFL